MPLVDELSNTLSVPTDAIEDILSKAPNSYKRYSIKKKSGGLRTIFQPSSQLKSIQYAFVTLYLNRFKIHPCAKAYRKGLQSPLLINAEAHKNFKFSIRVDLQDFFPSIKPTDLFIVFTKNKCNFSIEEENIITKVFFPNSYISAGLAIGSPASPIISNIVMYELDGLINSMAKKIDSSSVYTRYADDIIFSSNRKNACEDFYKQLDDLLKSVSSPSLIINPKKTIYMSKANRRMVTGLIITPDQKISLGRSRKRYIKSLVFRYSKGNLDQNEINRLKGYLAFSLDCEPTFFNTLVIKYGSIVNTILRTA
tara:strand:+ start:3902 stop:4831 length:930 start_codon:yes stop_codon:yes gene_type:complete